MSVIEKLKIKLVEIPLTNSMHPISCEIERVAFFPGGRGLWKDGDTNLSNKKYMILGQDFDTLEAFEKAKKSGAEDIHKNPTWRNLLGFLKDCGISPEDCFFTNAIMGARKNGKNSGRSPAWKDKEFLEACRVFFLEQLEAQQPELILVLGKEPARFLSPLNNDLAFWKKNQTFVKIDVAGEQVKKRVRFSNGHIADLVLLTHPSFRPSNVHRRKYNGIKKGHEAEVAMVKEFY